MMMANMTVDLGGGLPVVPALVAIFAGSVAALLVGHLSWRQRPAPKLRRRRIVVMNPLLRARYWSLMR